MNFIYTYILLVWFNATFRFITIMFACHVWFCIEWTEYVAIPNMAKPWVKVLRLTIKRWTKRILNVHILYCEAYTKVKLKLSYINLLIILSTHNLIRRKNLNVRQSHFTDNVRQHAGCFELDNISKAFWLIFGPSVANNDHLG